MKYIVCLGDGMADWPLDELNGKTPIEAANTPNMDKAATLGQTGLVHTVPEGLPPGSDVANMGILGYDPRQYYTGRAPIEAAAMGLDIPQGMLAFRANLVTIEDGIMKDFTAGHISSDDGQTIFSALQKSFGNENQVFYPGVSYRNIVVLPDVFKDLVTTPPHDITDKNIEEHYPKGPHAEQLKNLMNTIHETLIQLPINKEKIKKGEKPATHLWLWSQGTMPKLPSFKDQFNRTGGIVTAVDLLKGLGKLTELETPTVDGATGFTDTNYKNKLEAGWKILEKHDFVYLHIEAPDECGHMGDATLKTQAISDFDREIVGPVMDYAEKHPDTRVLILPDHPTPCPIKTHTSDPVPFVLYQPNGPQDDSKSYSESEAKRGALNFDSPWLLMRSFLSADDLTAELEGLPSQKGSRHTL